MYFSAAALLAAISESNLFIGATNEAAMAAFSFSIPAVYLDSSLASLASSFLVMRSSSSLARCSSRSAGSTAFSVSSTFSVASSSGAPIGSSSSTTSPAAVLKGASEAASVLSATSAVSGSVSVFGVSFVSAAAVAGSTDSFVPDETERCGLPRGRNGETQLLSLDVLATRFNCVTTPDLADFEAGGVNRSAISVEAMVVLVNKS
ncbi:hypothetical protein OGAPHI_006087 [Ogataea philodendri]|uniref:Uncharacterized protein n=1 Tax=Ogataea philodendri TaxID=1378263 RepID=A0A9P8T0L9_9ASCO|nr:uncharacterized protein OGAPHI_006087 [Ogataea philodendri]KAH3661908.1 hypothetical protein OGAPHI_006087 [Ogataea philodendri]